MIRISFNVAFNGYKKILPHKIGFKIFDFLMYKEEKNLAFLLFYFSFDSFQHRDLSR